MISVLRRVDTCGKEGEHVADDPHISEGDGKFEFTNWKIRGSVRLRRLGTGIVRLSSARADNG